MDPGNFFAELKRRNVIRMAGLYRDHLRMDRREGSCLEGTGDRRAEP